MTAVVAAGILFGLSGGVASGLVAPGAAYADSVRERQWWIAPMKLTQTQKIAQGDGVVVAVIDSGVDATHPDLKGAVLPGTGMLGSTSAKGWDDPHGHGTIIAGIIAARGGSSNMQMLGVAPKAKILPIALPVPFAGSISGPIHYAVDNGAKIINMSFGGKDDVVRQDDLDAIAWARSKGVILVAAGGNTTQGDEHVPHPGSYKGVITVNGTDRDGNLWSGALQDDTMEIAAPAQDVISTMPKKVSASGFGTGSGTSSATAMVSGTLALIWSKYPQLDGANVINRLFKTAVDKGPAGRDDRFGWGLIDPLAAVTADVPAVTADPLGPVAAGTASAAPGATSAPGSGDDDFGTPAIRTAIVAGVGLVVITIVILAIVLPIRAMNRRRERAAAARSGFGPPGGPGYPPPGYPPAGYPPPPGYPTGPVTGQQPPVGQFPGGNPPTNPAGFRPGGTAQFPATGQPPPGHPPAGTAAFPATGQPPGYPPAGTAAFPATGQPPAGTGAFPATGAQPAAGPPAPRPPRWEPPPGQQDQR
ncbi:S8 family serine peptidase [Dactylosporangium sp. NBC_01737]|uniref:S8 family serine peptidase n=1 Tax=Dactylosporangium sp. NBC_01737 TaxID=2975959 RepID=UPI002E10B319|nr:S8 family serine peptidase [Dactylosporangium sp. NBC_01737]